MLTIPSSDVRKEWSRVIDSVVRQRPAFIRRTRDHVVLCTLDTIAQLVSGFEIIATQFHEDDGSVTLSVESLDLVANGPNAAAAKAVLARELIEYAEEYYQEFELYNRAPNRKAHLPYVMRILTMPSERALEDVILCQPGKT